MDQSITSIGARAITANSCCGQLATALGAKVYFPGNATYQSTQASFFSLQEASLSPACIIVPESPQDVSGAVTILQETASCHFAIKGQTHAPAAGFANIQDGVTIDMTSLNSVAVDSSNTVASIGGGASWLEVYTYLDSLGLTVAGGRNGAVGVGGLTLGGGISYFGPRVGWACDNVVNFEIVLASGILTNINATSSPDLFKALKGGSNNFGIVTRFDLATFSQGQILAGSITTDISYRNEVFGAFSNLSGAPEYDPYSSIVTGLSFNSTSKAWGLSTTAVYTKPVLNPPVFDEFLSIPTTTNTLHLTNLSTLAAEHSLPQLNWIFFTGTYGVSAALLDDIFTCLNNTLYDFSIDKGVFWSIAFEPLPTVYTQYGDLKGGNSLGTSPKNGNAFIMLLSALWPDAASNDQVTETASLLIKEIAHIAKSEGLLHEFQYLNYADPSQNPLRSYGKENFRSLVDTSTKYDSRGVFQKQVPGGFKIKAGMAGY